jgi:hypothetical protein
MVIGQNGLFGKPAVKPVVVEFKIACALAAIQYLDMVERDVLAKPTKNKGAKLNHVLYVSIYFKVFKYHLNWYQLAYMQAFKLPRT